jgi:hypothetical protein
MEFSEADSRSVQAMYLWADFRARRALLMWAVPTIQAP